MGENTSMTPADLAAITNNGMNGEGSWIWFLLIFVLLGWGGGYGGRGGSPIPGDVATQSDVNTAINTSAIQTQLNNLALSSANNNYETAQLINAQSNAFMQQNYANQINMVQGFNNVSSQLMNQTNQLGSKLDNLGYQMESCCCGLKTLIQNNRIEDLQTQLNMANNALSNANQTQTILGNLGRFVAWEGSGTSTTSAISA